MPSHHCYCEVFGGAGNVLFKKEPSEVEIINDINSELVTLYRVVQNHLEEFLRYFKWMLISRDEWHRQMKSEPSALTDIQRAVRFYYLQKLGYGGKVVGRTFCYAKTSKPKLNLLRIEEDLSEYHLRLARVYIENLPYADVIKKYDSDNTLFYLDPPYHLVEDKYGKGIFSENDYTILANILKSIKGKFMLSINDTEFIKNTFKIFRQENVNVRYTICKGNNKIANELLITNY